MTEIDCSALAVLVMALAAVVIVFPYVAFFGPLCLLLDLRNWLHRRRDEDS